MIAYHSLTVIHPMWIPAAHKAAGQGNAIGLHVPDGLQGGFGLHYFARPDGLVDWKLVFRYRTTRKQVQVAKWTSDFLPLEGSRKPQKPCTTHGRIVTINRGVSGDIERQVRVVIDALGLPVEATV